MERFIPVRIDNRIVRSTYKALIIEHNGNVLNGHVTKAFEELAEKMLKPYERIDYTQIQNASSYFRFSKQQEAFRKKYNY